MPATPDPPIVAYIIGSHWPGLPSMSPFGLKLATWLRMADVPHDLRIEDDPRKGPKRKSPWIVEGDVTTGDSHLIIRSLEARGYGIDGHLTPEQRGLALHLSRSLENHLQQALEYGIFLDDNGWKASVAHFAFIPAALRFLVLPLVRRDTRNVLYNRGLGRHTVDEMRSLVAEDLDALAAILGERTYLFGDAPCTADSVAYGHLAVLAWAPFDWFAREELARHPSLIAYCERIRARWWAETTIQAVA